MAYQQLYFRLPTLRTDRPDSRANRTAQPKIEDSAK